MASELEVRGNPLIIGLHGTSTLTGFQGEPPYVWQKFSGPGYVSPATTSYQTKFVAAGTYGTAVLVCHDQEDGIGTVKIAVTNSL